MSKEKIYQLVPNFIQNLMVTLYNIKAYKVRHGGRYKEYRQLYRAKDSLSLKELEKIQEVELANFIKHASEKSTFYKEKYINIDPLSLDNLPIVGKEDLREAIEKVYTIDKTNATIGKTGGTTGKSLVVYNTKDDAHKRFAMLDNFRSKHGYELGKRTAWFSGKNLLTKQDLKKNRFWKTDYFYKVRYYSTFHIKEDYLRYYVEDLIKYKPEYLVGFPSTMLEIAKYGLKHGYNFPPNIIKAIFPTAETLTPSMRETIETFFKTEIFDQYASSEGAPFIFECKNHKLHMELQSGVFEVLDDSDKPCQNGRLVLTSFTTHGTPLIRYDIGDRIELSNEECNCGNKNPLVKAIHGRLDDYIYSPENGKINLGNISNTLKGVNGIIKFQVIQNELDSLEILIIKDLENYSEKDEAMFLQNWNDRVGNMKIQLKYVDAISSEKSGKYRLVKNNIKHLISQ